MKNLNGLIYASLFVTGFLIVWFVTPRNERGTEDLGVPHPRSVKTMERSVRPQPRSETIRKNTRVDDLLESLTADHTGEWKIAEISEADYPELLNELIGRAGLTGLDPNERRVLDKLIYAWYAVNPDAALRWLLALSNQTDVNKLLSTLIGNVACKDLDRAIALAERYGVAQGRDLLMSEAWVSHLGMLNTKDYLRVAGLFIHMHGWVSGCPIEYAPDFDFRQALDGLAKMQAGLETGTAISFMPPNILSEWAKRDWDAAYEWVLSEKKVPDNGIQELVSVAAATATTDELAGMAVQVLALPNRSERENNYDALGILVSRLSPELMASFIEQAPGERQENLKRLLAMSGIGSGGSFDTFIEILLSQMTPEERILLLHDKLHSSRKKFYESTLRRLGHSDQEIEQMTPVWTEE
jgi:hypothetical protein